MPLTIKVIHNAGPTLERQLDRMELALEFIIERINCMSDAVTRIQNDVAVLLQKMADATQALRTQADDTAAINALADQLDGHIAALNDAVSTPAPAAVADAPQSPPADANPDAGSGTPPDAA